jgi:hypothetical protein
MPIPNPSIDDVTFEQLIEEAKKNISRFSKNWTNYNLADPGITILELFSWLTDMQIYSLNKITKKNYLKFLKLLGIKPLDLVIPKIDLTIQRPGLNIKQYDIDSFKIPKGTKFNVKQDDIFVETDEDLYFIPSLKVKRCIVYSNHQFMEAKLNNPFYQGSLGNAKADLSLPSISSSLLVQNLISNPIGFTSLSSNNKEPFFFLFGKDPNENDKDAFYLNLEFNSNEVKKNDKIDLSFYMFDRDLPPVGEHGNEAPQDFLDDNFLSELKWDYFELKEFNKNNKISAEDFNKDENWIPLRIKKHQDTTFSFSTSGKITFRFPTDKREEQYDIFEEIPLINAAVNQSNDIDKDSKDKELDNAIKIKDKDNYKKGSLWIRCKLIKNNNYFIPPRIEHILTNTVSCKFGYCTNQSLKNQSPLLPNSIQIKPTHFKVNKNKKLKDIDYEKQSNGLSNQIFEVDDKLMLPILELDYLKVDGKKWIKVKDFDSSTPLDKHFIILDKKNGLIKFGDNENGKIPKKWSKIQVGYRYGNNMNTISVKESKIFMPDVEKIKDNKTKYFKSKIDRLIAINLFPSTPGRQEESIQETISRAREELLTPFKAISKTDCEYIVKNTPGLRIGKVKVKPSDKEANTLIVSAIPYSFSIIKNPRIYEHFKNAIRKHLEKHNIITTKIKVLPPEYLDINITIKIKLAKSNIDQFAIKEKIIELLNSYFSPIPINNTLSIQVKEWDFGQNVYKSNIIALLESLPEVEDISNLDIQAFRKNQRYQVDDGGNIIIEDLTLVHLKDVFISFM